MFSGKGPDDTEPVGTRGGQVPNDEFAAGERGKRKEPKYDDFGHESLHGRRHRRQQSFQQPQRY